MLGENKSNVGVPVFYDANLLQYPSNASNQLQLFRNAPVGCNPINNHVSTGLKLSYEDDERNSSMTLATGNMFVTPSILSSLGGNFRTEFDRQNEEFNQFIKTQEEHLIKGMRDMKRRHDSSFLTAIEKVFNKKIRDKDIEIENINRKNKELVERIKQASFEAQNWQYRAKYNESVVNLLKANLQQALSQGAAQTKEGFGDSEIDDTASCVDTSNIRTNCRVCKVKEVRLVLMPCRHLCLCIDCEGLVAVCPVCQVMKTASIQVDLS